MSLAAVAAGGGTPLRLLRNVEGIELVELPDAESCCGFGGTFALKNSAVSSAMLADKASAVIGTGASAIQLIHCLPEPCLPPSPSRNGRSICSNRAGWTL